MKIKKKRFEVKYKVFDVGEKVKSTSSRSPIQQNEIYTVLECIEPKWPGDPSIVFLDNYAFGVNTEYLIGVAKGE